MQSWCLKGIFFPEKSLFDLSTRSFFNHLLLYTQHIYTHIDPDFFGLDQNGPLQQTNIQTALKRPLNKIPPQLEGPCNSVCLCVCGAGGRSQEWSCVFDRSVFVDDLFPLFPLRCRLECIAQAAAASDKHSTGPMFATWGLSAYVCLHGR